MDRLTERWIAARDGDRMALSEAIRGSQAEVWRFAAHLVGRDHADDVTQDTYLRAWKALPAFRGESSARTWLLSITRRAAADAIRREQRRRRRDRVAAELVASVAADHAAYHATDALVAGLGRDQREAFVLTQLLGLAYDEAAAVCDVPIGTIRSRVARARESLVTSLDHAAEA
jgi:RNA polymerase sigma-70 factor (ECF subfamily)